MSFQLNKTALALAIIVVTTMTTAAQAGSYMTVPAPAPLPGGNWYVGIFGGEDFTSDTTSYYAPTGTFKIKNGYDVGGELGYRVGPFRFEGQYTYIASRLADVNNTHGNLTATGATINGRVVTNMLLANAFYDFNEISDNFGIFIGAGIGAADIRFHANSTTVNPQFPILPAHESSNGFGYQAIIGFNVNVDANFAIGVDYRYVGTSERHEIFSERFATHLVNANIVYHVPA